MVPIKKSVKDKFIGDLFLFNYSSIMLLFIYLALAFDYVCVARAADLYNQIDSLNKAWLKHKKS